MSTAALFIRGHAREGLAERHFQALAALEDVAFVVKSIEEAQAVARDLLGEERKRLEAEEAVA